MEARFRSRGVSTRRWESISRRTSEGREVRSRGGVMLEVEMEGGLVEEKRKEERS